MARAVVTVLVFAAEGCSWQTATSASQDVEYLFLTILCVDLVENYYSIHCMHRRAAASKETLKLD